MCDFFSFNSNGKGKYFYFDWESRKSLLEDNPKNYNPDSHSSIVKHYQDKGELALGSKVEDKLNKFEFNPLTKEFTIDQINTKNDSSQAESWVRNLDFKTVVKPLIIKPLIHPFKDKNRTRVTKRDIQRLKEWSKVRGPVRYSVRDSVVDSVWDSIWDSVRDSVVDSVWDSIWDSVKNSVGDSVRNSVWDFVSVWESIWDSINAYPSSFFNLPKWKYVKHKKGVNPFQSVIDLWESGLVPSFDGKIWRLHGGSEAKVLFEISKEDLEKK